MTDKIEITKDELIDLRISSIISQAEERIFGELDGLHKRGITDDEVIRYLRRQGYTDYADQYIDWAEAIDPDAQDNNTTRSDVVPDPGNSPTVDLMAEAHVTGTVLSLLRDALVHQREESIDSPYVDVKDLGDAVLDGHFNLHDVARHIAKGLKP